MPQETILFIDSRSPYWPLAQKLRVDVFVKEQAVPEEIEIDEYDKEAQHIVVLREREVIGTMRLIVYGDALKIGRVAVRKDFRRAGIGLRMMEEGLQYAIREGFKKAVLDSQVYVAEFYRKLGFIEEGEVFEEAGIPHIRMWKKNLE